MSDRAGIRAPARWLWQAPRSAPMPDIAWLLPAAVFVALQYIGAAIVTATIDYAPRPPVGSYLIITATLAFISAVVWTLLFIGRMASRGEDRPLARIRRVARERWSDWATYLAAFLLVGLQIGALTWLKAMLPHAVPFWADPMLAAADRWLLGEDAWQLAHRWFGWADAAIDWTYGSWSLVKFSLIIATLCRPPSFAKARAMLAYFLTMGLFGVVGQYALSSAGPIFYERLGLGPEFAAMPLSPVASTTANYLWETRVQIDAAIGGGISAMPSMHVATSVWIALTCWTMFPRIVGLFGTLFAVAIVLGSFYLGWHYLVDSLVGVAAAFVGWAMVDRYLTPKSTREGEHRPLGSR